MSDLAEEAEKEYTLFSIHCRIYWCHGSSVRGYILSGQQVPWKACLVPIYSTGKASVVRNSPLQDKAGSIKSASSLSLCRSLQRGTATFVTS